MARYIDADALHKDLVETLRLCKQWMDDAKDDETKVVSEANWFAFLEVKLRLDSAPTIDAVPVVRCKDCRYYQDNNGGYPNANCKWCKDETPDADDYCSCGERE